MIWNRATKRYKLVLIAFATNIISIGGALILLGFGYPFPAVLLSNIGTIVIYWIAWRLL